MEAIFTEQQNNGPNNLGIRKTALKNAEKSSFHGVSRIIDSTNKFSLVCWTLFFASSTAASFYLILKVVST